ncbi:MAG: hypothetical protein FK733_12145 [Asgard group archaeon]|nr:hypothetical protein [Asgard group archaeon]
MSKKQKLRRKIVVYLLIIVVLNIGFIAYIPEIKPAATTYFTLVAKVPSSNPVAIDCMEFIKRDIAEIGINLDIIIEDDNEFYATIYGPRDFDLTYLELSDISLSEMINLLFRENSTLNLWGYDITMDYSETFGTGKNEWFIEQFNSILPINSQDRHEICWEWQFYLMNELLPFVPLFGQYDYIVYHDNLNGFNFTNDLEQSWGKMGWDGLHPGQTSTNEINIADNSWIDLNPLFYTDDSSEKIINFCLDKLITIDNELDTCPMIAKNWNWVDNYTLDIEIREGINWPDYDSFTNEFVDVDDIYFTLYCLQEISPKCDNWFWLTDFEKLDDMTIRLHIDGVPYTSEADLYAATLEKLSTWILPEHILNQTQLADGITPDISHISWIDYSKNCIGTGLFEITSFTENVETILHVKSDNWRLNATITSDPALDYENRYGDYSGGLNKLIIKLIPEIEDRILEYFAGNLDLVIPNVDFFDWWDFGGSMLEIYDLQSKISSTIGLLAFNMREVRPAIGNREPCPLDPSLSIGLAIRKAIAYVIDKSEINQIIHRNERIEIDHPIMPSFGNWQHPKIIRYCYNKDVAIAYTRLAGYDLGWCGIDYHDPHQVIPDWEDVCDPDYVYPLYTKPTYRLSGYVMLGVISVPIIVVLVASILIWRRKA